MSRVPSSGWRLSRSLLRNHIFGTALAQDRVVRFETLSGLRREKRPAPVARHSNVETDDCGACTSRHWNVELRPSHRLQGGSYRKCPGFRHRAGASPGASFETTFSGRRSRRTASTDSKRFSGSAGRKTRSRSSTFQCRDRRLWCLHVSTLECRATSKPSTARRLLPVASDDRGGDWRLV